MALTTAQQAALDHVRARAYGPPLARGTRLTLNFHPDVESHGRTLLQAWAEEPVYLSQFVTGTSNGGLSAVTGGDRWLWESRMFGGAYDGVAPVGRPVYGALNVFHYPYGGAVRFGSGHLVLSSDLLGRATFCYPDSTLTPEAVGTAEHAGVAGLARAGFPDRLDDYVEAQVHGPVHLTNALELVLDPCFQDHPLAEAVATLSARGLTVRWHAGFVLTVDRLSELSAYRGPEVVDLGRALARDGILTPAIIGTSRRDPRIDQQQLKRLWHCLARFGYSGPVEALGPGT